MIQGYADRNECKNFFSAIKAVYGPPTKGTAPLHSADGSTLLTEMSQILQRWAEHFRGVLNRPSAIFDADNDHLPQVETNVDLDTPPSLQETIRTGQQLSSGKVPGSDAFPAEVYKYGGPQTHGSPDCAFPGDVASRLSSASFQRRNHRASLQAQVTVPAPTAAAVAAAVGHTVDIAEIDD
nr:unnamed protein product [Spirometra erinaceieuropaei]